MKQTKETKILKQGKVSFRTMRHIQDPDTRIFRATCENCECTFEFESLPYAAVPVTYRCTYDGVDCPSCGTYTTDWTTAAERFRQWCVAIWVVFGLIVLPIGTITALIVSSCT